MIQGERLLRGSGVAQQVSVDEGWKPYEWGGISGWDPAALGPMEAPPRRAAQGSSPGSAQGLNQARAARTEAAQARRAEFGRCRAEGMSVAAAGTAAGVTAETARVYERIRRQRAAGAA